MYSVNINVSSGAAYVYEEPPVELAKIVAQGQRYGIMHERVKVTVVTNKDFTYSKNKVPQININSANLVGCDDCNDLEVCHVMAKFLPVRLV